MEQLYTDKEVLQDALTAEKTATNNYNTYANECVHDTVREAILNCLSEEHKIQEEVLMPCIQEDFIRHRRQRIKRSMKQSRSFHAPINPCKQRDFHKHRFR